jgi:hypothetical protein
MMSRLLALRSFLPAVVLLGACVTPDGVIDVTYDACAPIVIVPAADATAAELQSVDDAIAMWREVGVAALTRDEVSGAPRLSIRFEEAAPSWHGQYEDEAGEVYINRLLVDRHQRAVTIAHELGHAFGLPHIEAEERTSVMNRANLTVEPTGGDREAVAALWGRCAGPVAAR